MSAEAAPRTAKKKRTRWAIIALVVVVLVALVVAAPMVMGGPGKDAAPVPTTTVAAGELVVTASADGQTEVESAYDVYPEVSGTVESVEVALGEKVKAGDTLFTLDDAALQSAVRQANAQLSQAKSQVAGAQQQLSQAKLQQLQAENSLDKLESMTGTMSASSEQITEAKRSVTVAKDGVTSANASLSSAKVSRSNAEKSLADARADLDKVTVVAPASGIVTSVNVAEGGSVSTGGGASGSSSGADSASSASASSMTGASTSASTGSAASSGSAPIVISDTSALMVTVAVNEVDIADVKAGQEATVTFDAATGLSIAGTVRWVSPNAVTSGNVRTYDVELDLAEQSPRLRPGMTSSADIVTLKIADALLVPKTAVRVDGTSKYVTLVKPDGSQEKREVTTGRSDETNVEILTGIAAGDKIATSFTAPVEKTNSLMPPRAPAGAAGGGRP